MPSLFPGYEYDIFISYRQKDNKGDRWVSEFVEAMKTELESTFKEEISVYFDINPHNGLLETHDVDDSLKDKLKCLVFIPIISRTYCDPKSFAWEHEFKAFVEQASQDQFGLKVKLPNGNVASRVLPIRIHELNNEDIKLCESVLGGILRGIEFIYKEPGVNKPLSSEDDEKRNLNSTKYRIQINKAANAIDEIIHSLISTQNVSGKEKLIDSEPLKEFKKEERKEVQEKPVRQSRRRLIPGIFSIAVLLTIAALIVYPKIFKRDKLDKVRSSDGRISVAVMPFQNITKDSIWNNWQDGIKDELINYLTNYNEELEVRQTQSINGILQGKGLTNYASLTPSIASAISQKLDAKVFVYGSIKQAGDKIRLHAQLIDSKTKAGLKSFQIDGFAKEEMMFHFIDSLSIMIKDYLIISKLKRDTPQSKLFLSTNSPDAYRYYIDGCKVFAKGDYPNAVKLLSQSVSIDSNYIVPLSMLSFAYCNQGLYDKAKEWCLKAYKKRDQMSELNKIWIDWSYTRCFQTPFEEIRSVKQLLEFDDQNPNILWGIGDLYNWLHKYDEAIPAFEKSLEMFKKWDIKPFWGANYASLGEAYHETGQYKKEKELYKKAEQDFPDHQYIIFRQAILALSEGDTVVANRSIKKYKSILKENLASEGAILAGLANIYSQAGILDKAEEYYRQALSLEPKNPGRINNLAYFLIDKDRNINEGMELIHKALKLSPENFSYLNCKGWGLYKQGKYKEALVLLDSSWNLRTPSRALMSTYFHREAAKNAVAGQKNN